MNSRGCADKDNQHSTDTRAQVIGSFTSDRKESTVSDCMNLNLHRRLELLSKRISPRVERDSKVPQRKTRTRYNGMQAATAVEVVADSWSKRTQIST
eukprot:6206404-Pleurochrysis_carterae.AAC.3